MRIGTLAHNPPPAAGEDNRDGNATRLAITWPNLALQYDATLVESEHVDLVDHDYRLKIAADPLLDIDIQVDVLDTLMKAAPAGTSKLIAFAKSRIEEGFESKNTKFRGELDIIFTAKSTINITEGEVSGRHNVLEHDVSGKPIKGEIDIPVSLEGVAKVEGKWFYISFKIDYGIRGDAGWKGEFEFGKDNTGVYCAQNIGFTGIKVTLTKYGEVKADYEQEVNASDDIEVFDFADEIETENATAEISFSDEMVSGHVSRVVEEEKIWTWLEPQTESKQAADRVYLVKR